MDPLHGYQPQGVIVFLGAAYIIIYYGIIFIKWLIHTIRYQLDNDYRNDEIAQEKRATEAKNLADNGPIASYFRRMGDTATAYEKRAAEAKKQAAEAERQAAEAERQSAEAKKQADETALSTPQITVPVAPSAAETILSQIRVLQQNSTQIDQRDNDHTSEMTEAEKRAAQAQIKQPDEIVAVNDIHVETANATQSDQQDNNHKNEMIEAEKRAVKSTKRTTEAKKQTARTKKQVDETTLANATQTTVPVALSATPAVPVRSFDDRINALLKMKASGLITDAEFDQKRKELLDSI
jgi:hypothetical protein